MAPVLPTPAGEPAAPVVEPPKNDDGSTPIPTTVAIPVTDEELTPEEAVKEIERLRSENTELAKWKPLARKHERELTKLRGTQPPAPEGTPAAPGTGPSDADLRALRFEVALDRGLPKALAVRLQGSTREEIEEDADELLELPAFKPAPAPPRFTGGADGGAGGSTPPKAPSFGDQVRAAAGIRLQG